MTTKTIAFFIAEMFDSDSLDNIVQRVEEVIVTTRDGYERHLTPLEAAQKIAGTVFRKHVEGQRISTCWRDDYEIGAQLLTYANYGNGFSEKFEYVKE